MNAMVMVTVLESWLIAAACAVLALLLYRFP